jgi:hypothetical protein
MMYPIVRGALGSALLALAIASNAAGQQGSDLIRSQQQPAPSVPANSPQSTLVVPGPGNPVLEIPGQQPDPAQSRLLPTGFSGCWEGTISDFDSLHPIGFLSSFASGTHTTYRFCYLPNGDGTYRMELRKFEIAEKELTPTSFVNQVVWVDNDHGQGYLRNHFTTSQRSWLLFIPVNVDSEYFAEEVVTLLNPNTVRMRGAELMRLEGSDYLRAEFHADFHRVDDAAAALSP